MDLATKLFSLSFGVEPNKDSLKELSDILNSAVLSLGDKQKALSDYVDHVEPQTYVAAPGQPLQLKGQKPPKPQVVWAIPEEKMKELLWKRAQLIQIERARVAREKAAQANGSTATTKKQRPPPPKLGKPKSALRNGEVKGASNVGKEKPTKAPEAPKAKPQLPKASGPVKPSKTSEAPKEKSQKPKPYPINTSIKDTAATKPKPAPKQASKAPTPASSNSIKSDTKDKKSTPQKVPNGKSATSTNG